MGLNEVSHTFEVWDTSFHTFEVWTFHFTIKDYCIAIFPLTFPSFVTAVTK